MEYLKIRNTVILSNSINVMLCGWACTPLALGTEQMKKYLLGVCKLLFKLIPYLDTRGRVDLIFLHMQPLGPLALLYTANPEFLYGELGVTYNEYIRTGMCSCIRVFLATDSCQQDFEKALEWMAYLTVTVNAL